MHEDYVLKPFLYGVVMTGKFKIPRKQNIHFMQKYSELWLLKLIFGGDGVYLYTLSRISKILTVCNLESNFATHSVWVESYPVINPTEVTGVFCVTAC